MQNIMKIEFQVLKVHELRLKDILIFERTTNYAFVLCASRLSFLLKRLSNINTFGTKLFIRSLEQVPYSDRLKP